MHPEITDEIRETASLWSLGALSPEESVAFEGHFAECDVCRTEAEAFEEIAAALSRSIPEVQPGESLRNRVLARTKPTEPGMHVTRSNEGKWTSTPFPGVRVKVLYVEPATKVATLLLHMEAGATYPAHRHSAVEQCLVLEGDLRLGQTVLGPGDYNRNDAFSTHGKLRTDTGCKCLMVVSLKDELLE